MASFSLNQLNAGNFREAAIAACKSLANIQGPGLLEAAALAAVAFEKSGDYEASLKYWDQIVQSAPHKIKFLDAAIRSAWRMQTGDESALVKAKQWLGMLDWIYTAIPPFELLYESMLRGWHGNGAVGIKAGKMCGWLWLPDGEKPAIRIQGAPNTRLAANIKRLSSANNMNLYSIEAPLPQNECLISLLDGKSRHLGGSPLAAGWPQNVAQKTKNASIAIIVPVYGDRKATLSCLASIFASRKKNARKFEIILVWDGGKDQRLWDDLRKLAQKSKISLIVNMENLGFIGSINIALRRCQGDAILLNADTIVHGNWVDRLAQAAELPDAATVTALSNEAELMSYPSPRERGKLRRTSFVRMYDAAAATLGPEAAIEIPVGVGFCMLITRMAVKRIGGLDGRALFRGYGEEVDFCLRAAEAGMRNYGAFHVFVGHLGSRSFGAAKKALAAQNNEIIAKRFPDYRRAYEIFLLQSTARKLREKLSLALLSGLAACESIELRAWGYRNLPPWQKDTENIPERPVAFLFLKPGPGAQALLRIAANMDIAEMNFNLPEDRAGLSQALSDLRIERYIDMSGSEKVKRAFGDGVCGDIPWTEPPEINLPLLNVNANTRVVLCPPPGNMRALKALLAFARENPQTVFYIFELESVWRGIRLPSNILAAPPVRNYSHLNPDALVLSDNHFDAPVWQKWLQRNGCAGLKCLRIEI